MLGKIEGRRRKGRPKMAGWHHQCNEHELGQTPKDGVGQRGLVCCSMGLHDWATRTTNRSVSEPGDKSYKWCHSLAILVLNLVQNH